MIFWRRSLLFELAYLLSDYILANLWHNSGAAVRSLAHPVYRLI